jgi:hypothetical protein
VPRATAASARGVLTDKQPSRSVYSVSKLEVIDLRSPAAR